MKLDRTTWYYVLNDAVFGRGYSEANANLCEYFWGTLLAFVAIIPVSVYRVIPLPEIKNLWAYVGAGIFIAFTLFISTINPIIGILYFVINILVVGGAVACFNWDINRQKKPKAPKQHRPNLALSFLKAKKGKYCPRIEWE